MKEFICICCPKGCRLIVDNSDTLSITGNSCEKGIEYAQNECTNPTRVLTGTVAVSNGTLARCPVKTIKPIPKGIIFDVMAALSQLKITAPIKAGQVISSVWEGMKVDFVATRTIQSINKK